MDMHTGEEPNIQTYIEWCTEKHTGRNGKQYRYTSRQSKIHTHIHKYKHTEPEANIDTQSYKHTERAIQNNKHLYAHTITHTYIQIHISRQNMVQR